MVKKKTVKPVTAGAIGVGIGTAIGAAIGHFALPVIAETIIVPQWAKDVVSRLSIEWEHPSFPGVTWWLKPRFIGMGRWRTNIEAHYIYVIPAGVEDYAPEGHLSVVVKLVDTGGMGIYMTGGATPNVYLDDVFVGTVKSTQPLYPRWK